MGVGGGRVTLTSLKHRWLKRSLHTGVPQDDWFMAIYRPQ